MKKIIIAALSAILMLTGCGASTFQNPTIMVVGTAPTVGVALETMPTTEPKYEFGDIVFSLETWPDGTVRVCRHAVVAHVDNIVMVTTAIGTTAEDLRAGLPGAFESWSEVPLGECIEQIKMDALYSSEEAAQAVADEMMSGR